MQDWLLPKHWFKGLIKTLEISSKEPSGNDFSLENIQMWAVPYPGGRKILIMLSYMTKQRSILPSGTSRVSQLESVAPSQRTRDLVYRVIYYELTEEDH